jgi:hypothetical protein
MLPWAWLVMGLGVVLLLVRRTPTARSTTTRRH